MPGSGSFIAACVSGVYAFIGKAHTDTLWTIDTTKNTMSSIDIIF